MRCATFDWPGQGDSYRLLPDPLKAHIENFAQYDAAFAAFLDRVVKPIAAKPPIALAHSMGGHNLMRMMHDRPNAFTAAVCSAPMLRTTTRGIPRWIADTALYLQNALGNMYYHGLGMPPNYVLAYMWSNLAATNRQSRNEVAEKMTSAQIAEGERMSERCLQSNYAYCGLH